MRPTRVQINNIFSSFLCLYCFGCQILNMIYIVLGSKEDREIQFWVANSGNSSFWQMAIHGQSLFRLNYPIKLFNWHHFCSSWNGKTGEWQLWVKAERVGRGFHNRVSWNNIVIFIIAVFNPYRYNTQWLKLEKLVFTLHLFTSFNYSTFI